VPEGLLDITTADALSEKKKLQKHFARFDILFFLICTLVGLDTIGAAAAKGAQAFSWLIILGILFFVPYALLTAELGAAFPEEGGSYVWTRLAFGRGVAAVNALIYWISNPIWVGGTLAILALTAFEEFFFHLGGPKILGSATILEVLFVLAFIWFTVIAAILSFKIGKWIPTIGAWVRMLVLGFFTLTVLLYAVKHGVHGVSGGDFGLSYFGFIGLVPLLFFNYVGFELPSAAGEEMNDPQKDVPYTVFRSAVGTILLYGLPILAILVVLPATAVTSLGGFLDAIKTVFTVYGGSVAADGTGTLSGFGTFLGNVTCIAFILALVSSGTTWVMGADRAQAVAALDGAAPRVMGIFSSKYGTPIAVNLMSGVLSTIVMVLAFTLTKGDAAKYFTVVLGLAISTTTISYIGIFPTLYRLRKKYPDVPRPYRVPGGDSGALAVSAITTFFAVLASVALIWPGFGIGWFGTGGSADDSLATGFTRWQFEWTQIVPLLVFLVAGILFYVAGTPTRRKQVAIPFARELAEDAEAIGKNP
jgi:amino acid transporter